MKRNGMERKCEQSYARFVGVTCGTSRGVDLDGVVPVTDVVERVIAVSLSFRFQIQLDLNVGVLSTFVHEPITVIVRAKQLLRLSY